MEKLTLKHYGYGERPDLIVNVRYVKSCYYDHDPSYVPDFRGKPLRAYDVYVDDRLVGRVRQTEVSTSRSPMRSRIRYGIGAHLEWSWDRRLADPNLDGRTSNYPGLYKMARRDAVADMLGYDHATMVRQ